MNSKQNRLMLLFLLLTLLSMAFIFSNSLRTGDQSEQQSGRVITILKPILDPVGKLSADDFSFLVRKAAHMTEFALLGLCLSGLMVCLSQRFQAKLIFPGLFWALATAVTDEFLQSFSPDRGSSVRDVLIDFSGACLGLLAGWLLWRLMRRRSRS